MDNAPLKNFEKFVKNEITLAVKELKMLGDQDQIEDQSRIHVQRLVFANLVDRFDTMIDLSILENCREEHLADKALKNLTDPITESGLLRFLMGSDNLKNAINLKVKDGLRNSVLRERHSKKLNTLFTVFRPDVECFAPKVDVTTGKIVDTIRPQSKDRPYSICGHADWLYSKRNSIVHGKGNKLLPNDLKQLKKLFKCTVTPGIKTSLASVKNAITFYNGVVDLLIKKPLLSNK